MKTLKQIWNFAFSDRELPVVPPAPYELAMRFGAALLQSGRYGDDFGAAMDTAWLCVMPYYQGEVAYKKNIEMHWQMANASSSEADVALSQAEARAWVAGEIAMAPNPNHI